MSGTQVNRATGDSVGVGQTAAATCTSKQAVPGTDDILHRWSGNSDLPPAAVPRNANHLLGCTRLAAP